jgi:hypothetical protein
VLVDVPWTESHANSACAAHHRYAYIGYRCQPAAFPAAQPELPCPSLHACRQLAGSVKLWWAGAGAGVDQGRVLEARSQLLAVINATLLEQGVFR